MEAIIFVGVQASGKLKEEYSEFIRTLLSPQIFSA
jgi:hypothetical protein